MGYGEESGKDDAGETELETEVRQPAGELLALGAILLPALMGHDSGRRLGKGGLGLEAPPAGLTVERVFV